MGPSTSHNQHVLQEILDELKYPVRFNEITRRIKLCQEALRIVSKESQPEIWGFLENNLGINLAQSPTGERSENLEKSIGHFERSLEVRTREKYPKEWASTQNNLATVYRDRIRGERAENIDKAIQLYEQALEVRTLQADPASWGITQNNLGITYYDRTRGNRAENLEKAIQHFNRALKVRTRQRNPEDWAVTQNNLATAYRDRIYGKRAENVDKAIQYYQQVLEVRTREVDPEHWAMTLSNLSVAYTERICGNRAENLEKAIQHSHQAQVVYTPKDFPEGWAQVQNNLGNAYLARIQDERAENIEKAINHYERALQLYTRQAFPQEWASLQYNLANAYRYRIRGDQIENIKQAIFHSKQALNERTLKAFPEEWAQTQNNLGNIFLARVSEKPEKNIEQAIHYFRQALKVYNRKAFPEEWARTLNNLGNAYLARIRDKRTKNIEKSIRCFRQALKVRTYYAYPEDWAQTQSNLAGAYIKRIRCKRTKNIEKAIQHLQQTLQVYTRQAFPQQWAGVQNNLAIAYTDRKRGKRANNIEKAINHYQQALRVYTCYTFPENCLKTARSLGHLAFDEQRWELARENYVTAFAAQDVLMQASFSFASKQVELGQAQNLPSRAAHVHVQLGEVEKAVEVLEKGRAQLMRESLERRRQDLEQLPKRGFEHLYQDYKQAINEFNMLQSQGTTERVRPETWMSQIDQVLKRVQEAAVTIRTKVGRDYPQYRYFMQALPFVEIQKQALEKPLVYLNITSVGGLALVINAQGVQTIKLPELNQKNLQSQIWHPTDKEIDRINAHLKREKITVKDIQAVSGGYFSAYALWSLIPHMSHTSDKLIYQLFTTWKEALDETAGWLWEVVMGALVTELKKKSQSVTLIPAAQLSLLPLHAAWTKEPSKPTGRLYALDELSISYAPSAHALWQAGLAATRPVDRLMAVDNPDGSLTYSSDEVQAAMDVFNDVTHLPGEKATVAVVKEKMQKAHVLHFSTHGRAGWEKAEQAQLKLVDGHLILPDIFSLNLNQTRLAVLSACETGIPGLELIDEMIGLPAGLMQAGVPGVVGSLWAVSDMSTAMLMARFYSLWRKEGCTPPEALRQAQIWLRDSTTIQKKELFDLIIDNQAARMSANTALVFYEHIAWNIPDARIFASPLYWAAFTYTGV